jgi:hypothetical protein
MAIPNVGRVGRAARWRLPGPLIRSQGSRRIQGQKWASKTLGAGESAGQRCIAAGAWLFLLAYWRYWRWDGPEWKFRLSGLGGQYVANDDKLEKFSVFLKSFSAEELGLIAVEFRVSMFAFRDLGIASRLSVVDQPTDF